MKKPIIAIASSLLLIMPISASSQSLAYSGGARYVCYDTRSTSRDAYGNNWVQYRGCHLSYNSCGYNGSNHFGRYPNNYQAQRALNRCRTNNPRFVD